MCNKGREDLRILYPQMSPVTHPPMTVAAIVAKIQLASLLTCSAVGRGGYVRSVDGTGKNRRLEEKKASRDKATQAAKPRKNEIQTRRCSPRVFTESSLFPTLSTVRAKTRPTAITRIHAATLTMS